MSDKEKLDKACFLLSIAIKNSSIPGEDIQKKWAQMALTSTQKRAALARQNRSYKVGL